MQSEIFDFFGLNTKVCVKSKDDLESIKFFYNEFISLEKNKYDLKIFFNTKKDGGIMNNFMENPDFVSCSFCFNGQKPSEWKSKGTILPPLSLPPLNEKFFLMHGASIVKKNCDEAALIVAEHYQGKTSLTLSSVANFGFQYLTEDLLVIERKLGYIHPLNKPGGIRYRTIPIIEGLKEKLIKTINVKKYISHITGELDVVKLNDVYKDSFCKKKKFVKLIIFPHNGKEDFEKPQIKQLNFLDLFEKLSEHSFANNSSRDETLKEIIYLLRGVDAYTI